MVGLYSGIEIRGDGSLEMLRDESDADPKDVVVSVPRLSRVVWPVGAYQPHQATVYRTLSAEGEDIRYESESSDHEYRRY